MYLTTSQTKEFGALLKAFFTLPYSTDLDGKDAETLLRIVKNARGRRSKRKELFDIIDGNIGYSVKTLFKSPTALRVDLQEQRFCDVDTMRKMLSKGPATDAEQGEILLGYMHRRITDQMTLCGINDAKSLILLKHWDAEKSHFSFRYWEEDFLGYIDDLRKRNEAGEIEWLLLPAGIHARDRIRADESGKNVRLLRMHQKHNQIFTDHDIPSDAIRIEFTTTRVTWERLATLLGT